MPLAAGVPPPVPRPDPTAAVHSAEFTDGSHLTWIFSQPFGTTPSTLVSAIDWLP